MTALQEAITQAADRKRRDAENRFRRDDMAFWQAAYCAALQGCLAHYGDSQNDSLAASICAAHADAALTARQAQRESWLRGEMALGLDNKDTGDE